MPEKSAIMFVLGGAFFITGFVYALLGCWRRFLAGRPVEELTSTELKIRNGTASFAERFGNFMLSLIAMPFHIPSYVIAVVVTVIFIIAAFLKWLVIPVILAVAIVIFILKRNSQLGTGQLVLCNLAMAGTPIQITMAIRGGASVKERNAFGRTPLMFAARNNSDPEVIKTLITYGANINEEEMHGVNSLTLAAEFNPNPEVINALIQAGADVNRKHNGITPLMSAAELNSNPEVIKALLQAGANVNEADKDGTTPLICAARQHRSSEVIKVLIEAGADVKQKDCHGRTAFDYLQEYR